MVESIKGLSRRYIACGIPQPFANDFTEKGYEDAESRTYGIKSVFIVEENVLYRGDVVICSTPLPVYPNMLSGATLGLAELFEVKKTEDFTQDDWNKTCIAHKNRRQTHGYGLFFRNPRPVVEYPVSVGKGISEIDLKEEIVEYPRQILLDRKAFKKIHKQYKHKKK